MNVHKQAFISPSQVKTLVIPIGIHWSRESFIKYIQKELIPLSEIRLVDITPLPECTLFNSQGFPAGRIFFNFLASTIEDDDDESMIFLNDFEPFRKSFVVIGLIHELDNYKEEYLNNLKTKFPNIICHNIINITNSTVNDGIEIKESKYVFVEKSNLETIICDIARNFLECLEIYYKSYKHVTLRSPGAIGGTSILRTTLSPLAMKRKISDASILQRSKASYKLNSDNRLKSRARQLKVLANLQLMGGQYHQSLLNFNEAALLSHKMGDYLWLSSALEGISICIILLSYINCSVAVPSVIYTLMDVDKVVSETNTPNASARPSLSRLNSPRTSTNSVVISNLAHKSLDKRISTDNDHNFTNNNYTNSAKKLISDTCIPLLIKQINDKILHYYDYTLTHNTEFTPQIVYIDTILRFLDFMSSFYCSNDLYEALQTLVLPISVTSGTKRKSSESILDSNYFRFDRVDISDYSNNVLEFELSQMNVFHQLKIYTSLAILHLTVGFTRKSSFFLRYILMILLKEPRPIYYTWENIPLHEFMVKLIFENGGDVGDKLNVSLDSWGLLAKSILNSCILLSKKYGERKKSFLWSMKMLEKYHDLLTVSEQIVLLTDNIISIDDQEFEWFIEFELLQGIFIFRTNSNIELPTKRKKNFHLKRKTESIILEDKIRDKSKSGAQHEIALENEEEEETGDDDDDENYEDEDALVFNPYRYLSNASNTAENNNKHKDNKAIVERVSLLVGEIVSLEITVKNIFKFNVDITSIELLEKDQEYFTLLNNSNYDGKFVLPAESTRKIYLQLEVLKSTDKLRLESLKLKVFQFKPHVFKVANNFDNRVFEYEIIEQHPEVYLESPPQTLIIQEGSKSEVTFNLFNKSLLTVAEINTLEVDFNVVQKGARTLPAEENYEIELRFENLKKCLKIKHHSNIIACNKSLTFSCTLDLSLGISIPVDFDNFDIFIEYGIRRKYNYYKTIGIPVNISILKNLEIFNVEILPFQHNQQWVLLHDNVPTYSGDDCNSKDVVTKLESTDCDWYNFLIKSPDYKWVLYLDIRNSWIENLSFTLKYRDYKSAKYILYTKHSKRFAIPIDRHLFTENVNLDIPSQNFKATTLTSKTQFWIRENVLKMISCNWVMEKNSEEDPYTGRTDLRRYISLSDCQRFPTLIPENEITLELLNRNNNSKQNNVLKAGDFTCLKISSDAPGTIILLLLDSLTGKSVLKSNRVLFNGKRIMPIDKNGVKIDMLFVDSGMFELNCLFESNEGKKSFSLSPLILKVDT
ncbi:uncharacterized protein SCODWIG_02586 [Saccharomycodes ludwigii]|uniref:Trafficking protein particle complex II-specific subunit 120 n=1 Tax=Saccharomycodes ludwigii TaxID=36035 RepID=A0A376B830_9ASCO|nr:hypothetical protein SCDLUD_003283 [Saccharomycodes ludwigii]KAH3900311.1 hypothetical protein SCDLUD_003283 [Saccharomycodes ludwigii]SSD60825.1 uncharacterized protein SCODWIG_02586 [Saccharomycodes ludwigii]